MYTKNQLLEVEISDLTSEGEGVGKADGFPFFVKDTVIGDKALIRVTKVKKTYGYGRLEKILEASPLRVEPRCRVSRQCGGCQIQSMSYEAQLDFKNNKVRNNLIRIGGFGEAFIDSIMEPVLGMPKGREFGYRNKAQFPFGEDKEGNPICGFYAGRTHSIISNTDCALGVPENEIILEIILNWMKLYGVKAYDEVNHKGILRHALIRKGYHTDEIMVCLIVNVSKIPHEKELVSELVKVPGMKSISLSVNKKVTNVIMGNEIKLLWGESTISDTLLGLKYEISPLSFYQVNPYQVENLYGIAIEYADVKEDEEVWDLCCGIGTITLSMASKSGKVHGIEIVPEAIEDAKKNALVNHINNAEFICAPAEEYLPAHRDEIHADVIVMDPPRKGMDIEALKVVVDASPSRIVYVSCDSATLSRDLKFLCDNGYELKKVRAVDMFPETVHVETVCLLSRKA